ncbi:hypothetical protein R0J89_14865, partial [Psychrobacter sp. SIMBA_152]
MVLAVLGSAAGEIISQLLDVPAVIGVLTLMLFVGILTFFGSKLIERVFVGWSALLFFPYIALFASTFTSFDYEIMGHFNSATISGAWAV